ncbi:MAG: right-handed parallel beta-helix repeat-containing protein [Bryobacterales bacterium]|nr:right-handed parallel beta-helix repeat-containing protein [Bryobacterales bacterium]
MAAPLAALELDNVRTIEFPGAVNTVANGINDAGDIAGHYKDTAGIQHGFLLKEGKFTPMNFPGAASTLTQGINKAGDMAGFYRTGDGVNHGFFYSGGKYISIDVPDAMFTNPFGLNDNGEVVGHTQFPGEPMKGFVWKQGRFSFFTYPEPNDMGCGLGINNNGDIVGHWRDTNGVTRGYVLRKGRFVSFEFPGARATVPGMAPTGISSSGEVVGQYTASDGKNAAFLRSNDAFTTLRVPGAAQTIGNGINNVGDMVGFWVDSKNANHGWVARMPRKTPSQVLTVDDDGADCPNSLRTIQEAVTQAQGGATILVCSGTYRHTVEIAGAAKNALKLIAVGGQNEVVLQGDYTERDGFHLKDVNNVLIRGFTVRDFGNLATTATAWGDGKQIYLENAHYNTIEFNQVIDGDMMGIMLLDSSHNLVRHNTAFVDRGSLANCGIHIQGTGSVANEFTQNQIIGNLMAGIMLTGAGPDNHIADNSIVSNGRFGITNSGAGGTLIEGNRVSYNGGPWGLTPYPVSVLGLGRGISVTGSDGVVVFDNRVRGNSEVDIFWDGAGSIRFDANACDASNTIGVCAQPAQR